jgi:hypothetical protein
MVSDDIDKPRTTVAEVAKAVTAVSLPKAVLSQFGNWTKERFVIAIGDRGLPALVSDVSFEVRAVAVACVFDLHMPENVSNAVLKNARFPLLAYDLLDRRTTKAYAEIIDILNRDKEADEKQVEANLQEVMASPAMISLSREYDLLETKEKPSN